MTVTARLLNINAGIDPRGNLVYFVEYDKKSEWKQQHNGLEPPPSVDFSTKPGDVVANTWDAEYALWIMHIPVLKENIKLIMQIAGSNADVASKAMKAQQYVANLINIIGGMEKAAKEIEAKAVTEAYKMRQEALKKGLLKPNK